jgi:hypothetical protein
MRSAILAIIGVLAAACQQSDVSRSVGARCDVANDCDQRCLTPSSQYPGGFCTTACESRNDCPDRTTCVTRDREGGVCLFTCMTDSDCLFLGEGWRCLSHALQGGGILVNACAGG